MSVITKTAFLLILALCAEICWSKDGHIALWKSLLMHYSSWAGYLQDNNNNTRYIISMRTLSVPYDEDGLGLIEFTSQHFTIEMDVYSDDGENVLFKEVTTWKKENHFRHHSHLEFKGRFIWDEAYYKLVANVSSSEDKHFGHLTLLPEGSAIREKKSDSYKKGLYIGIPVVLFIIVCSLGGLVLYWGFRKGYLRHVPWSYKSFPKEKRAKEGVGIDMRKDQQVAEEPSVHI